MLKRKMEILEDNIQFWNNRLSMLESVYKEDLIEEDLRQLNHEIEELLANLRPAENELRIILNG